MGGEANDPRTRSRRGASPLPVRRRASGDVTGDSLNKRKARLVASCFAGLCVAATSEFEPAQWAQFTLDTLLVVGAFVWMFYALELAIDNGTRPR